MPSDFTYDSGVNVATKSDLTGLPSGADPTKYLSAGDCNTWSGALNSLRDAIVAGRYHGLTDYPTAPVSEAGGASLRANGGSLEISQNGGAYATLASIVGAASTSKVDGGGLGVANHLPFWSSTSAVGEASGLYWDDVNSLFFVGATADDGSANAFQVTGAASIDDLTITGGILTLGDPLTGNQGLSRVNATAIQLTGQGNIRMGSGAQAGASDNVVLNNITSVGANGFTVATTSGNLKLAADGGLQLTNGASAAVSVSNGVGFRSNAGVFEISQSTGAWQALGVAALPSQSGNSGKYLTTNGSAASWASVTGLSGLTTGRVPYASSSTTLTDTASLAWDTTNQRLTVGSDTANFGAAQFQGKSFTDSNANGMGSQDAAMAIFRNSQALYNASPQSGILFAGAFQSADQTPAYYGGITWKKKNTTTGDAGSVLSISTRPTGLASTPTFTTEALRLDSDQKAYIASSLDRIAAGTLSLGTSVATAITFGSSGITTTIPGQVSVGGTVTSTVASGTSAFAVSEGAYIALNVGTGGSYIHTDTTSHGVEFSSNVANTSANYAFDFLAPNLTWGNANWFRFKAGSTTFLEFNRSNQLLLGDGTHIPQVVGRNLRLQLFGQPADASNAIAMEIGCSGATLANATAKLVAIQNNAVEKAYFDKDGGLNITGPTSNSAIQIPTSTKIYFDGSTGAKYMYFLSGDALRIRSDGQIRVDPNGNDFVVDCANGKIQIAPNARNQMYLYPGASTGNPIRLEAAGGDADVDVKVVPKGAGRVWNTAGVKMNRTTVADAAYTVLGSDYIIAYTSLTTGRAVTLPAPSSTNSGQIFIVKDEAGSAGTNNLTVSGASGNIDGAASYVISTNYGLARFYSNGSNYFTV
jgi:hypothetical protein